MVTPLWQRYLLGAVWWLALPVLVTLTGLLPGDLINQSTLLLLYLCTVLYTSLRADRWAVLSCATLSFLLFSYFYTEPRYSLRIDAPDDVLAAVVFLVFALLAGHISLKISRQLERLQLLKDAERKIDEEQLRSALLASVSHDLKTPLVTMLGAATSLRDLRADLSADDAAALLDCIIGESGRLESYIQNLLDMTRLGHGKLALSRDWVSVEEIWHVVEKRIARQLAGHRLVYRQQGELPVMYVHAALVEQALFNAIDNALKAGGTDQEILVDASWHNDVVTLLVCDHGPGLPASEWEAVFDQFYTFSLGDCYEKGTGLGLSICRSIFRVHGGEARIVPAPAGYSHCLELTLPVPRSVDTSEGEDT